MTCIGTYIRYRRELKSPHLPAKPGYEQLFTISLKNLVKHLPFEFVCQRSISEQMNFLACPSPGPRMCPCSSRHTTAKNAFSSDILDALKFFKDGQHAKTHLPSPSSGAMLFLSRRPRRARTCSQKLYFEAIYWAPGPAQSLRGAKRRGRGGVSARSEGEAVKKVRAAYRRRRDVAPNRSSRRESVVSTNTVTPRKRAEACRSSTDCILDTNKASLQHLQLECKDTKTQADASPNPIYEREPGR